MEKQHRRRTPTLKQIKALQLINQGYTKHRAMIEAGYSKYTAKAPANNLMNKRGVQSILESMKSELADAGLTGKYWAGKFKEWAEAQKLGKFGKEADYETQVKAFDRWEKRMGELHEGDGKNLRRKVTFEEFVTGEEKNDDKLPEVG